jgi:hypothetical protein
MIGDQNQRMRGSTATHPSRIAAINRAGEHRQLVVLSENSIRPGFASLGRIIASFGSSSGVCRRYSTSLTTAPSGKSSTIQSTNWRATSMRRRSRYPRGGHYVRIDNNLDHCHSNVCRVRCRSHTVNRAKRYRSTLRHAHVAGY